MSKKEHLFYQGVKALRNISNVEEDIYACPLCLSGFKIESLENGELTLEHVPPESAGGKGIILTCKRCNNEAGSKYDSHISKRDKIINFAETLIDKNVDISTNDGKTDIAILKHNNPATTKKLSQAMKSLASQVPQPSLNFQIETRESYEFRKYQLSLLKSAFLVVVAKLGYKYACSPELYLVRKQLLIPEENILENWNIDAKKNISNNTLAIDIENGVILVVMCGEKVLLPWPPNGMENYIKVINNLQKGKTINFTFKPDAWPKSFEAVLDNGKN